jgi:8-oxo-dGTP diphosphatase
MPCTCRCSIRFERLICLQKGEIEIVSQFVYWGKSKVKLTWKKDYTPPRHLITSVHGYCFHREEFLMIDLNDRGWDFPGGHIEKGETPESCFKREAMEEGYVEGDCTYLGCIEIDHCENPEWNENSPYPKVGYQAFYRMDITKVHPFLAQFESGRRQFIDYSEVANYYKKWNDINQAILESALQVHAK